MTQTGRVLTIGLTQEDVEELNALSLCTSMPDCYAVVDNTCIAGNLIAPEMLLIAENFTGDIPEMSLIAENFTGDITSPAFIRFLVMDLDEGEMSIEFSETILVNSATLADLVLHF